MSVLVLLALLAASAPDPRKGEPLDGRAPPPEPGRVALAVPRLVLVAPRLALRAVLTPLIRVSYEVEERGLLARAQALTTSDDGKVGVRPDVRYQTDVGLAAGLRYFDRRTLGEGSLVQVAFRAGGEALLGGELRLRGPRGLVGLHAGYDRNRRTLFAPGLRYGADRGRLGVDVEHRVGSFFGRAAGDLRVAVLTPGPEPIPGFVDSTRLLDAGLELGLDTRRKRPYDTGVALVAGASGTRGFDGDPSRFATFRAEGRATIGLADRALGVRLRAAMLEPLGEPVPFDELLSAAGPEQVRGNPPGTLRGHSRLVGSLEYQWMPVVDLEITAFVDHGGAFGERFAGLSRDGFEPSLGGAVRWGDARLQLAWGPGDGVQLLAGVGW